MRQRELGPNMDIAGGQLFLLLMRPLLLICLVCRRARSHGMCIIMRVCIGGATKE